MQHDMQLRVQSLGWRHEHLIEGEWVSPLSDAHIDVVSPRDQTTVGRSAAANSADVDRAVTSARHAFDDGRWSRLSPTARGEVLVRLGDLVAERAHDLALRISLEMGKPVREALEVELSATSKCLRWYGQLADKLLEESPSVGPGALALITREAAGVVAAILPWNFPLTMAAWKLGPALLAGNSVVLKPAEQTPFSALDLGELALEAGLPPGVLNVIPGTGPDAGAALGRHQDVDIIAFTGSVATGRRLMGYAAESNGKRVWPELGGKTASIILPDADVERAATTTAWGCFYNSGQMCTSSSRMVVHRDVADEAIAAARTEAKRMAPGDPLDWDTPIGPVVTESARQRILSVVDAAVAQGAELVEGGVERDTSSLASSIAPIVLTDVRSGSRIAREEVFGPVLSVLVVDDAEQAVRVANETEYGLGASLWTKDLSTAHHLARQLRSGTVWVNCFEEGNMAMPFGGVKASGFGRDKGIHAVDKYTDVKSTWIELA